MVRIKDLQAWLGRMPRLAVRLGRFALHVLGRFRDDGCFAAAGALSYTTLVSLVPLLAISLAVLSAFPIFDKLREQALLVIFDAFVPRIGGTVERYINGFVQMSGKTTAVGTVVLAVTAIMLLATIEDRLNAIWRVHAPRSWSTRIMVYWTVLTLGPVLFGLALTLPANLEAAGALIVPSGAGRLALVWLKGLEGLLPLLFESLGLMGFYALIPHGPVRWRDGLIGAVVAALLIEASRLGFSFYLDHFNSYDAIYGALAVLPIFLLWMYLTWSVVLVGAEVAAAIPLWQDDESFLTAPAEPDHLAIALGLLAALAEQAQAGGAARARSLAARLGCPDVDVIACLDRLGRAGFIATTSDGGFVLARDLGRASLLELQEAVELDAPVHAARRLLSAHGRRLEHRLAAVRQAEAEALSVSIASLLEDGPRGTPARRGSAAAG